MPRLNADMNVIRYAGMNGEMHVTFECRMNVTYKYLQRCIRFADIILEWGLLDCTRFASKTAQFACKREQRGRCPKNP